MAKYLEKQHLRDLIVEYNLTNLEDDGSWLDDYLKRETTKYNKGKMSKEEYDAKVSFVNQRKIDTKAKFEKYAAMDETEKRKYNARFEKIRGELWIMFEKIARGRMAKMGLHVQYADHLNDIAIDTVLSMFNYMNRYDSARDTSAFAYMTQQAYFSIVSALNEINFRNTTFISGLDFFENINTIDNPVAAYTATQKYIKALE